MPNAEQQSSSEGGGFDSSTTNNYSVDVMSVVQFNWRRLLTLLASKMDHLQLLAEEMSFIDQGKLPKPSEELLSELKKQEELLSLEIFNSQQEIAQLVNEYVKIRVESVRTAVRIVLSRLNLTDNMQIQISAMPTFDNQRVNYTLFINLKLEEAVMQNIGFLLQQRGFQAQELPVVYSENGVKLYLFDNILDLPTLIQKSS